MIVSYKTEINPTQEQIQKINQTIGTCRYIYNFYLATQKERYKQGEKLQSAIDFSKWLNNDYLHNQRLNFYYFYQGKKANIPSGC